MKIQAIILTINSNHKIKTGNIIKVSKWCYLNNGFINNKMSFIHAFISAN